MGGVPGPASRVPLEGSSRAVKMPANGGSSASMVAPRWSSTSATSAAWMRSASSVEARRLASSCHQMATPATPMSSMKVSPYQMVRRERIVTRQARALGRPGTQQEPGAADGLDDWRSRDLAKDRPQRRDVDVDDVRHAIPGPVPDVLHDLRAGHQLTLAAVSSSRMAKARPAMGKGRPSTLTRLVAGSRRMEPTIRTLGRSTWARRSRARIRAMSSSNANGLAR